MYSLPIDKNNKLVSLLKKYYPNLPDEAVMDETGCQQDCDSTDLKKFSVFIVIGFDKSCLWHMPSI